MKKKPNSVPNNQARAKLLKEQRDEITKSKKAGEELRKLSRAVEQSPATVVITDAEGTIEYVNPHFVRLTGYTVDEAIGQNPRILKSGQHSPEFYQQLWGTITSGKEWRGEFCNKKKDGDLYWEFASISPVRNEEGLITHFVGVKVDITERKRTEKELRRARDELKRRVQDRTAELENANEQLRQKIEELEQKEEALRQAELRYRTVADFAYDWEYWENPDGSLRYVSPSCERITGYKAEQYIARPQLFQEIILLEDKHIWGKHHHEATESLKLQEVQFRIRRQDGQIRWIEHACQPVVDSQDEFLGFRASNRDITCRKQAEEALRESDEVLRKKEDSLSEAQRIAHLGNWDWNIVTNELVWTDEIYRIFGLQPQEFGATYEAFLESVHPDDRESVNQAVNKSLADPNVGYSIEHRVVRPDGSERVVHERGEVAFDKNGKAVRMIGTVHDITERKRAEQALRESESALRKSQDNLRFLAGKLLSVQEEERRRLAREMHDDLTQRLAVLAIEAGKLEQQLESSPEPLRDKLRQMKEQMVRLSADVHDISRQLHPAILDDLGLADAIKSECANFSRRERISVKYEPIDIPNAIPKAVAMCVYRIMQEGLRNIAKHANVKEAEVLLTGTDDGIRLCVKDNGVGFDPAGVRGKGGLGLASMEERVRLIQGEFSIQSQPGQGTAIELRAPLSRRAE